MIRSTWCAPPQVWKLRAGGREKQWVLGLEGQGPSSTSAPSAEGRAPSLGWRRWAGEGRGMHVSWHAQAFCCPSARTIVRAELSLICPSTPRAQHQGRHKQMLTDWRMDETPWLEPLCQEAGLGAGVSVSPNGRLEPNASELEFAQGGAMGITILTAMTTTV